MSPDEEEAFKKQKREEKYNNLHWTGEEDLFRTRTIFRHPKLNNQKISLSLALKTKLKCSCFGRFMKTFNEDQFQNFNLNNNKLRMEEWDLKHCEENETQLWEYYHNFSDNLFDLLKTAVGTENCIDYEFLYNHLTALRLCDCQINYVDNLKKYKNLQILILAGNWIKQIKGNTLPKQLEFLECFANEICDISKLCYKCPERIKHLGLGRNRLNNDSCCHLLATSQSFVKLCSLDLSHNNFADLTDVLTQLSSLPQLTSLALEGNPCYTCKTYKENILLVFPKLLYLDDTEILPEDRQNFEKSLVQADVKVGALIFTCYRLIAIPPPPKGKARHSYYIEIETPLLEEIKLSVEEIIVEDIPPAEPKIKPENARRSTRKSKDETKNEDKKGRKSRSMSQRSSRKSKVSRYINGKGLYALPDEYEDEIEKHIVNNNFRTEGREWSQVIKFNNPAIIIDTPDNNLELLRDTFRSRIKIKIVYIQKQVVNKTKKEKKKSKDKIASITGPKDKDNIVKKSTFATFFCDLHSVNWSDQYVDFLWTDHPKFQDLAVPVNGSLKPEIYAEKKRKGKKSGAKSDKKSKNSTKTEKSTKQPLPTKLTCHFGFGLSRYGLIQETVPLKVRKSKKKT